MYFKCCTCKVLACISMRSGSFFNCYCFILQIINTLNSFIIVFIYHDDLTGILVLSDPDTYAEATAELKANDMSVSLPFRQRMAARTFAKTSRYDAMIAEYLTKN